MITPKEIKDYCLKWWKEVLVAAIDNNSIFPRELQRIGKIGAKDILLKLSDYQAAIEALKVNSKEHKTLGYRIGFSEKQFDKIGKQQVPDKIFVETLQDYLKLVSKEKEYDLFVANLTLVKNKLPELLDWVKNNPLKLIEHNSWSETLNVCTYFLSNPKPNLYLRQLPIDVHTKYISERKSIIQTLLEYLIPEHVNCNESKFELRFNLKYAEPLIRVRFLDDIITPLDEISDISFTLSEFHLYNCESKNVFVAENLMNFLTLPKLPKTIAIWSGGGFNVSYLKNVEWLKNNQFYYWGDLDAQGFQILNQFRAYFVNTIAVMMDEETLENFTPGKGKPAQNQNLGLLSEKELQLYQFLKEKNIRLEQEKIPQIYAEAKIMKLFSTVEHIVS